MSIGNAKIIGKLVPLFPLDSDEIPEVKEKSEFIKTWPIAVKLPAQEQKKKPEKPKNKYKARKKRKPKIPLAELAKPEIEKMIVSGYVNTTFLTKKINPFLKPALVKVYYFVVIREIIQHKGYEFISIRTIMDGWKRGYDYGIAGTELSRPAIYQALEDAKKLNLLFIYDKFKETKEPLIILNTDKGKEIYDKLISGKYTYTDIIQFDVDLYYAKNKTNFFELISRQEKLDILNSGILLRCKVNLYTCKLILHWCKLNLHVCKVNSYKKIVETIASLEICELSTIPELIINGIKYVISNQHSDQPETENKLIDTETKFCDDEDKKNLKNIDHPEQMKPEISIEKNQAEELTPEEKEKIVALKKKLGQHKISAQKFDELISTYGYLKVYFCVKDIEEKIRAGVFVKTFSGLLINNLKDFDCTDIIEEQKSQEAADRAKKDLIEKNKKYLEAFKFGRNNFWSITNWDENLKQFADFWLTKYQDYSTDIVERANYIMYEKFAKLAPEHQDKKKIDLGIYNKPEEEAIEILSGYVEQQNSYFEELLGELGSLISPDDLKIILLEAVQKDRKTGSENLVNNFISVFKGFL